MAYEGQGIDLSFVAGEDISAKQYTFVHLADDNTVDMMDSATEYPVGILQNAPGDGETAVVRVSGISQLVAHDALAVGAKVKAEYVGASDNGKADAADTAKDNVRGIVLVATGAEDDMCTVLLCCDTLYAT